MDSNKFKAVLGILRLSMGLDFLWAFADKLWGLGFSTCRDATTQVVTTMCDSAWLSGGSPTTGFLKFGVHGPFAEFFNSLANYSAVTDWLFMLGLLFVGVTLTLGIIVRLGSYTGALMLALMYLALIPPEHHPFIDDHFVYFFVMLGLAWSTPGRYFGLGNKWWNTSLVQKYPWLA